MAHPVTVGGRSYPSKKALRKAVQQLLDRLPVGSVLIGPDHLFVDDLLNRHPWADEVRGLGLAHFQVVSNMGGHKALQAVRVDGSLRDWSFYKATHPPNREKDRVQATKCAFRHEIHAQVWDFKLKAVAEGQSCPVAQTPLVLETTDIDHVVPFRDLLRDFLAAETLALLEVVTHDDPKGGGLRLLTDRSLAARWQSWHQEHAVLKALYRDAHRAKDGANIRPLDETRLSGSKWRAGTPAEIDMSVF